MGDALLAVGIAIGIPLLFFPRLGVVRAMILICEFTGLGILVGERIGTVTVARSFYGTVATIIPVLILALILEQRVFENHEGPDIVPLLAGMTNLVIGEGIALAEISHVGAVSTSGVHLGTVVGTLIAGLAALVLLQIVKKASAQKTNPDTGGTGAG